MRELFYYYYLLWSFFVFFSESIFPKNCKIVFFLRSFVRKSGGIYWKVFSYKWYSEWGLYVWVGTVICGGNFMVRGQFSRRQFSSRSIVWEAIFLGGNYPHGQFSEGQLSRGQWYRRQLFGDQSSSRAIVLVANSNYYRGFNVVFQVQSLSRFQLKHLFP